MGAKAGGRVRRPAHRRRFGYPDGDNIKPEWSGNHSQYRKGGDAWPDGSQEYGDEGESEAER